MSSAYPDRDDYSEQDLNVRNINNRFTPDFHVVPSSSQHDPEQQDDENGPLRELIEPEKGNSEVEQSSTPIEWYPAVAVVGRLIKTLLSPIVKIVFAPRTQRAIIKSLATIIVVVWIFLTSFTAYLTFYQRYIPKTAHIEPIYFQYTNIERPWGKVYFSGPNPNMPLRHEQAYDVSVQLHVPASDVNFDLGNFMVHAQLLTRNGTVLAESNRPAILRYQSYAQRILHVMAKALPLLIGWTEESQHINVVLLESFVEKKAAPVTQAHVKLSSFKLQVYDAHISVIADFRGLRYYMYHRRVSTAFIFIVLFTMIEAVCAIAAWKMFGKNLWNKLHETFSMDEASLEDSVQDHAVASQYDTDEEEEDGDSYLTEE
ncbi:putative adipose-regulatory protein-domain-containing protein [Parasitella parasitica]|nr:putative adipose-regulatory protein-domain-containing protein [Parasitella parasitica]